MLMDPRKIRLWGDNPRYTDIEKVNFQEIGKNDFVMDKFDYINKDIYEDNVKKYYLSLIKNDFYIEKMLELVESISEGFNPDIDEILITRSEFITKHGGNLYSKDTLSNIFYALEGNRRLMAIHLLLDFQKVRDWLKIEINVNIFKKFEKVFKKFDQSNINLNEIEVKFYKTANEEPNKIWKTLNTRHFGKRKGKLNWPRGLVLDSIYKKVFKLREQLGLQKGEKIEDKDLNLLKKELENFTGKVISESFDLKNALFVHSTIEIYNSKVESNSKIFFSETNEETDEIEKNEEKLFSISALELSMNSIKLLKNGMYQSISKIIELNIDIKKWEITSNLENNIFEELMVYIIKLIKANKLNTRKFDPNYSSTVFKIINSKSLKEVEDSISKNINNVKFENVSLSMLIEKNKEAILGIIEFAEDSETRSKQLKLLDIVLEKTIPALTEINSRQLQAQAYLQNFKNKYEYTLIHLWEIELLSLIKNHENNLIENIPMILFSASFRITSEILQIWILEEISDWERIQDLIDQYEGTDLNSASFKNHLEVLGETYHEHIEKISNNEKKHNNPGKRKPGSSIYGTYNFVKKLINENELIKKFVKKINHNEEDIIIEKNLKQFLTWILNQKEGRREIINTFIHEPHFLLKIRNEVELNDKYNDELLENVKILMNFIDFIMSR